MGFKQYYFKEEHELFRKSLRDYLEKEVVPYVDEWEKAGELPPEIWKKFGDMGYFGLTLPEKYGGSGLDFWYDVVYIEELSRCGSAGFAAAVTAHPYLSLSHLHHSGSEYLKEKYLRPGIAGDIHGGLAITEPFTGSDVAGVLTTAVRDGDHYIINGSKCFITNGVYADYLVVTCKTNPEAKSGGISLIVVDMDTPGISTHKLDKLGWKASDTGEIAFDNVRVPVENLVGEENKGFYYIMQRFELERLTLAIASNSASEYMLEYALNYMSERKAFGRPINKFQVLRHRVAQMSAEIASTTAFTYDVCKMYSEGVYCVKEASMSKLLSTELADKVAYQCLQFLGGYGYMEDYKMARAFRDTRLGTIGGGTSEIMREIISKMIIDDVSYQRSDKQNTHKEYTVEDIISTLPERFKAEKATNTQLTLHFIFTNKDYSVLIKDGQLEIKEGQVGEADCLVETDDQTYIQMETGQLNPQQAFMSGKVKVSDLGKMMEFGKLVRKLEN
ncbi:MAG: acyl-CoA dehydrogenase family protein [Chitinophagales bacterium]|nr:acyl-CoA dehydrogenase family protein [Chitinophagales bacterium]